MKIVRAAEAAQLSSKVPADPETLQVGWLEGPFNGDRLDVGLVTATAGGATPPHSHIGGQVMIVLSGRGFVETGGERVSIAPGDVVICPPGELHTHGAEEAGPLSHLTVTTGGYEFPGQG